MHWLLAACSMSPCTYKDETPSSLRDEDATAESGISLEGGTSGPERVTPCMMLALVAVVAYRVRASYCNSPMSTVRHISCMRHESQTLSGHISPDYGESAGRVCGRRCQLGDPSD